MVGETHNDLIGSRENEISAIGVGYGFGTSEDLA
jgi:hypothetical protein